MRLQFVENRIGQNMCVCTNSKSYGMFDEGWFLDSTADRINLGLRFEVLYILDLYSDVINHVLVFFLYVSDMLCSYMLGGKIPYSYTLGRGVSETTD